MLAHSAHKKKVLTAIALTCVAYLCFNLTDAGLKTLTAKFYFAQIMVMNGIMTILFLGAYGAWREGRRTFRVKKPGLMLLRGIVTSMTGIGNLFALPHVSLSTFYTLAFTSPLIVALLSAVFLREKPGLRRMGVILFGFASIVCVFRPGSDLFNLWTMLVLLGAFCYSCSLVLIRHLTQESRPMIFMSGSFIGMAMVVAFLPGHVVVPDLHDWGIVVLLTLVSCIGVLCISHAFQTAPSASTVAPYHYTQIIWGALLGWFVFKEIPDTRVMAGACAIIASGLYLIHSETRRVPHAETVLEN